MGSDEVFSDFVVSTVIPSPLDAPRFIALINGPFSACNKIDKSIKI